LLLEAAETFRGLEAGAINAIKSSGEKFNPQLVYALTAVFRSSVCEVICVALSNCLLLTLIYIHVGA
jgi:hypothetical protein